MLNNISQSDNYYNQRNESFRMKMILTSLFLLPLTGFMVTTVVEESDIIDSNCSNYHYIDIAYLTIYSLLGVYTIISYIFTTIKEKTWEKWYIIYIIGTILYTLWLIIAIVSRVYKPTDIVIKFGQEYDNCKSFEWSYSLEIISFYMSILFNCILCIYLICKCRARILFVH